MPYRTGKNSPLGVPNFLAAHDTRAAPVGDVVKAYDDVLGEAEFIFLPGVAGCLAGDVIIADLTRGAESIQRATVANTQNSGRPIYVSLNDCGAGLFGWFQMSGLAVVNAIAGTVAGAPFISGTAGQLTSTDAAGVELIGAVISTPVGNPSAGKSYVTLNRPAVEVA